MLELTVNASGKSPGDLEMALEVVLERVREGYTSGFDSNDTGRCDFTRTGEEDPPFAVGDRVRLLQDAVADEDERDLVPEGSVGEVRERAVTARGHEYGVQFGQENAGDLWWFDKDEAEELLEVVDEDARTLPDAQAA